MCGLGEVAMSGSLKGGHEMSLTYSERQLRVLEKESIQCADVAALLDDLTDHEVSCTLRARLEAHLRVCPECRELDASYRMTVELASELADRPVPRDVQNRLRDSLNKKLGLSLKHV